MGRARKKGQGRAERAGGKKGENKKGRGNGASPGISGRASLRLWSALTNSCAKKNAAESFNNLYTPFDYGTL